MSGLGETVSKFYPIYDTLWPTVSGCNTVSISVSSLFANAKHQQNQGQVVPKVPVSSLNNSQRKVAILPLMGDGKNESCVAEAEEVPKHCEPG
jgi:hypothetical protein